MLWVLTEEDREAQFETARVALLGLMNASKPTDAYLLPDSDDGTVELIRTQMERA